MTRVSVVFTEHEECGALTVSALLAVLEKVDPEVIFLECPPEAFSGWFDHTHHRLERTAVARFRETHSVDLVPVDLPTPDSDFFADFRELIERVARVGPEFDRLASWHRQHVEAHGLAYLNSAHCSDLRSKRHEAMLAAIAGLADPRLAPSYESWLRTNRLRDAEMVANIREHCRLSPRGQAALLVGAAHRQSIIELTSPEPEGDSSQVQWDFGGFLSRSAARDSDFSSRRGRGHRS
jgi:hypothetical protein